MKIYFSITKCDIYVGVDMDFFPWSRLFKIFFFVPFYLFEINFLYVQLNRMSSKVLSLLLLVQKHQPSYNYQITTCTKGVIIKFFNEIVKIMRFYVCRTCRMELETDLGVLKNQIILHNSLVYGTAVCF